MLTGMVTKMVVKKGTKMVNKYVEEKGGVKNCVKEAKDATSGLKEKITKKEN